MNRKILRSPLIRSIGCESGTAAILAAVLLAVIMWCAAFAVDVASLYLDRRTAQGAVDLAAMAAARDLAAAERLARATLDANGIRRIRTLSVTPGNYRADAAIDPAQRFVPGAEPHNAVRVSLRHDSPLHFAGVMLGMKTWEIGTEAVATTTAQGAFSIGSRLLRVDGGLLNAALGGLLGGNITLTVMDYEALASANVKLFQFMEALATELKVTGGTYNEVLAAEASAGNIIDAMAAATQASGDTQAAAALRTLGAQSGAWSASVPLHGMIDLGPYGDMQLDSAGPGFDPSVNAMQMVSAAAAIANGARQVTLNLGAAIPGLAGVKIDLAIGEPPRHSAWFTVGDRGAVVRTAQTRLRIVTEIAPDRLLPGVSVRVPLYTEVAYAEGRLDNVTCGADPRRDGSAEIAARPGIAEMWIGEVSDRDLRDFSGRPRVRDARMVQAPALRVTGMAHAAITNTDETVLSFDWDDIEEGRVKSTATRDYLATLLRTLIGGLDLEVRVGGLGLALPGPAAGVIESLLKAAVPALDSLVSGLLEALGVTLGEADIRVHGIRCDGAALVG